MCFAGSSSSNTIQPTSKIYCQDERVKPLPFSSIALFQRGNVKLCLGVMMTPFKILVGSTCQDLLMPPSVSHY